jgi:hypothetical protein
MANANEIVVCAAVKLQDGRVFVGMRHDECYKAILKCNGNIEDFKAHINSTAGFMTNRCRFLNRKTAYEFAERSGQLLYPGLHTADNRILTSEDLW